MKQKFEHNLLRMAEDMGFSAAALIVTSQLVFEPAFRQYCEDNSCGMYQKCYTCPPYCGSPEDMKSQILAHKWAFVLQTMWDISDIEDWHLYSKHERQHDAMVRSFIRQLPNEYSGGFMTAAGGCSLCEICALLEQKPCRFPELKASSISAYCIHVQKLTDMLGWDYNLGADCVAYLGLYVFD